MRGGNGTIAASPIEVLERFVEAGWPALVRAAQRALPLHDAEDAVQEASFKAAATYLTLRDPDSLRVWFGHILENECRNRIKRKAGEADRLVPLPERSADDPELLEAEDEEPEEGESGLVVSEGEGTYGNEELSIFIRSEVERLPDQLRAAVEGVWLECRSTAAFAREAGIPARTLGYRLDRAFELLRLRLARLMRGLER
ncbi:MAG: sigma-70 family RNA polymerase sigma factor [Planctomycetes bacterium]|nr:sigma-70 family RNA polymerase sigma factor [Planctomycetota bacterium]